MYKTTPRLWWLLRQGFTYLVLLVGLPVWYWVSSLVRDGVAALGNPITTAGETTATLAEKVSQLRDSLRGIALVGPELSKPFIPLQRALEDASDQTLAQLEVVEQTASVVFWIVFLVPVAALVWVFVLPRIKEAIAAARVNGQVAKSQSLDLLALRAVANSDISELYRVSPDPAAAWRAGDPAVLEQLARLELQRFGLKLKRAARS
ncbi:MAG: hypothetical protein CSA64_04325 [Arachnia propionica]|nr:MAG: hypothetical protein CSA64_04325 [Arachnia propionica]